MIQVPSADLNHAASPFMGQLWGQPEKLKNKKPVTARLASNLVIAPIPPNLHPRNSKDARKTRTAHSFAGFLHPSVLKQSF
jgi:hypothetical protein